jgi:hypothetical protein
MMILNMFDAVVLEGFSESMQDSDKAVNTSVLNSLRSKWSEFDPKGVGWLSPDNLCQILHEMTPPFGFRNMDKYPNGYEKTEYNRLLSEMEDLYINSAITDSKREDQLMYKFCRRESSARNVRTSTMAEIVKYYKSEISPLETGRKKFENYKKHLDNKRLIHVTMDEELKELPQKKLIELDSIPSKLG